MHESLCSDVKAHVDVSSQNGPSSGWCYHVTRGVLPLRLRSDTSTVSVQVTEREDVASFFNKPDIKMCGWMGATMEPGNCELEMNIDDVWTPVLKIRSNLDGLLKMNLFTNFSLPTFMVVDNFYKNPDIIRDFALKLDFQENPKFHKGKRCINPGFRFPGLKEQFECILNAKIDNFDKYETNGCFQYCIAGEQAVFHSDFQQYAGVLFLTPDAPPQTGTRFYRSRVTKKMKAGADEYGVVYKTGHLDSTQFDEVDAVGNVYNRIVLFDARLIHAAPLYFGTDVKNGRLFQLFFFDVLPKGN
jgi:hypothetical protein